MTMGDFNIQVCPFQQREFQLTCNDLYSYIQSGFPRHPHTDALIQSTTRYSYTYETVRDQVERVAYHMTEYGVGTRDVVGFCASNSIDYIVMMLATWRLGGVFCGINSLLTQHEVQHLIDLSEPTYIFTDNDCVHRILQVAERTKCVKVIFLQGNHTGCISYETLTSVIPTGKKAPTRPAITCEDVACILYSSGTTGLPKAVQLSHRAVMFAIDCMLSPNFSVIGKHQLLYMPMSHIYGILISCCSLLASATTIVMKQFYLEEFLDNVCKYKVEILHLVPPLVILLSKHPVVSKYDLSHVNQIYCTAAPIGQKSIEEFLLRLRSHIHFGQEIANKNSKFRNRFLNYLFNDTKPLYIGYGMTETSGPVTMTPSRQAPLEIPRHSIGVPVKGMEVKVIDIETGRTLGPNQSGEICCRGPGLMTCYMKNAAATNEAITDGWMHTGDIGYYNKDGAFFIVDRLKELIKYKGYQVAPAEIEDILLGHPLVADTAVIGVPHEDAGEVPLAWIVKKEQAKLTEKQLIEFIADRVAPYKRLRGGVEFVSVIPKSSSGKILRNQIRQAIINRKGKL